MDVAGVHIVYIGCQASAMLVTNCKLIRINNQVLLDDGNKITIPQGNFKILTAP